MGDSGEKIDWETDLPGIEPLKMAKDPQLLEEIDKVLGLLSVGRESDEKLIKTRRSGKGKPPASFTAGLANNKEIKTAIMQIAKALEMERFGLFSSANMQQLIEKVTQFTTKYRDQITEIFHLWDDLEKNPLNPQTSKESREKMYKIYEETRTILNNLEGLQEFMKAILDRIDNVIFATNESYASSDIFFEFLEKHPECVNPKSITEFLAAKLQEQKEKINHPDNTSLNKYKKSWKETLHILREKSSGNKIFFVGLEDFIKNHLQNFSEELGASIKDEIQQFAAEIDDRVRVEGMLNPKSKK